MKLFKVNVDYGQFVYAVENKQQLIDYLKENDKWNLYKYDNKIDDLVCMTDEEIDKMIVEVDIPEKGVHFIGGYQE